MRSLLFPLMGSFVWTAALGCSAAAVDMPDCVGIRPGMAVTEARERLKAYDSKLEIREIELQSPSLGEKPVLEMLFVVRRPTPRARAMTNNTPGLAPDRPALRAMSNSPPDLVPYSGPVETLQAEITLPPNKPVVWKVVRSLPFEPGEEQTRTALFTALGEKYGKESFTTDFGPGNVTRYWVQGPDGNLVEGPGAKECSSFCQSYQASSMNTVMRIAMMTGPNLNMRQLATVNYMGGLEQPRMALQNAQQCQTMRYVIAELSVAANRELVNHLQITVVDAGLDTSSREATRALIKHSETATEKQRVERAKQQPIPKF